MNIKAFFVDALSSALDLGIGTPEDVLRHVTPDVLAEHLPRPLWARLFTACLGAPRVDARLVIETIGIANLCEHVPAQIIWACIAEIGTRSLGAGTSMTDAAAPVASTSASASGRSVLAPPPEATAASSTSPSNAALGPNIPAPTPKAPLGDVISELEQTDAPRGTPPRGRSAAPSTRFRQSSTGVSRGGFGSSRRPQAAATPAPTQLPRPGSRRGTEVAPDPEPETAVGDWREKEIAVDDSQLVDWQTDIGAASAITGDDDFSDLGTRKR